MGEIINLNTTSDVVSVDGENTLAKITASLLVDARSIFENKRTLSMPIAELSTLGAGVSSLIPAFNTVTQTTTIAADGLYRIANASEGTLKYSKAKDIYWGSLKTATGGSKMAQLTEAGPLSADYTGSSSF